MLTFEEVIRAQFVKRGKTRGNAGKLIKILDWQPTTRFGKNAKARFVKRLEDDARRHFADHGVKVGEDWSTVSARDWDKFFESLANFLMAIVPLLLKLFGL